METRQPRNKQQAQCGVERSRRARRLRGAPPRRQPHRGEIGGGTAANQEPAECPEKAPMRCAFGATRAGALLGRLRLHLQTERFLAVRRDDAIWEAACLVASVALGELVEVLSESEMQAPLSRTAPSAVPGSVPSGAGPGDAPNGAAASSTPCGGSAR